jgi:DNA-binding transcriptional LysR family regulator
VERNRRRRPDPRLIEPFVVLARHLHFRTASAALAISQQTLSDRIRRLEDQLDVVLFTRDSRHVALTGEGERLLSDAQIVMSALDRLVEERQDESIRLGAVKDYGPALTLVEGFRREHPADPVDIVDASSVEQLDALRRGALDVGILRAPAGGSAGVSVVPLQLEPVVVAVGPLHPLAGHSTIPLAALTRILCGGGATWAARREWLDALASRTEARWTYTAGCGPSTLNAASIAADRSLAALVPAGNTAPFIAAGCSVRPPRDIQPYYAWSLAWRPGGDERCDRFVERALHTSSTRQWLTPRRGPDHREPWLPDAEPVLG